MGKLIELAERAAGLHERLAASHPKLTRGMVWCRTCGRSERVDSATCLRSGWPKCCGYTMTIDSPEESQALSSSLRARDGGEGL